MKYRCIAMLSVLGYSQAQVVLAEHVTQKRRHFTPQAVVLAKQKLVEISHRPRGRQWSEVRDTLESLLTDYGVNLPRARANDLLQGRYTFLREVPPSDRTALATVVADLVTLFPLPPEAGLMERLSQKLSTLSALQKDENPTVRARAKRLMEIAQGSRGSPEVREKWEQDAKSTYWTKVAVAFLKRGRAGLLHYSGLTQSQVKQLAQRRTELEGLAKHPKPLVAERARILLRVIAGEEVTERSTQSLLLIARGFLRRGEEGLKDYTEINDELVEALVEEVPKLEALAKDKNPVLAKRALWLLKVARRESTKGHSGSTLKSYAFAFLEDGKAGLLAGVAPSDQAVGALARSLPKLEILAKDENDTVAERAAWLMEIAKGRQSVGPDGVERKSLTSAFLNNGRVGLLLGRMFSRKKLALLTGRLAELEGLTVDEDPGVAERARWLVELVTNSSTLGRSAVTLTKVANKFLERGRVGLLDYDNGSVTGKQLAQLRERRDELETISQEIGERVAGRAKVLIKLLEGDAPTSSYESRMVTAFLLKGRDGLLVFDEIGEEQRMLLKRRLPELKAFSLDEDPKVAARAKLLIRIANNEAVGDRTTGNLRHIIKGFFNHGREGLIDYEVISNEKIEQLIDALPELNRLAQDESEVVAKGAKVLINVARHEETGYGSSYATKLANAFFRSGRAGILGHGGPSQSQIARLRAELKALEELSKDTHPNVAERASALVVFLRGGGNSGFGNPTLREFAGAFLGHGRAGLVGPSRVAQQNEQERRE